MDILRYQYGVTPGDTGDQLGKHLKDTVVQHRDTRRSRQRNKLQKGLAANGMQPPFLNNQGQNHADRRRVGGRGNSGSNSIRSCSSSDSSGGSKRTGPNSDSPLGVLWMADWMYWLSTAGVWAAGALMVYLVAFRNKTVVEDRNHATGSW